MEMVLTPKGGEVPAGVQLETDVDGTVDVSNNEDEEWLALVNGLVADEPPAPTEHDDGVDADVPETA